MYVQNFLLTIKVEIKILLKSCKNNLKILLKVFINIYFVRQKVFCVLECFYKLKLILGLF